MESHRLPIILSAVGLALSVLALAMALAFVNPWREPGLECQAQAPEPETLEAHPGLV